MGLNDLWHFLKLHPARTCPLPESLICGQPPLRACGHLSPEQTRRVAASLDPTRQMHHLFSSVRRYIRNQFHTNPVKPSQTIPGHHTVTPHSDTRPCLLPQFGHGRHFHGLLHAGESPLPEAPQPRRMLSSILTVRSSPKHRTLEHLAC